MHHYIFSTPATTSTAEPANARVRRAVRLIGLTGIAALILAGCTAPPPSTGTDHVEQSLSHVHGIVPDPAGEGFLLGTHDGIYPTNGTERGPRIGSDDFDAMGLAVVDGALIASGHPGRNTPADLGTPNLGIIRSTDRAATWLPVALTGEKDFHALTAGPDGTIYGLATDGAEVLLSTDQGDTWSPSGASLIAVSLAVDAMNRIVAATPDGVQVSTDSAASFAPWPDAPLLFMLNSSPDHQRLVGVGSGGKIWVSTAGATEWTETGTVHGTPQAIAITNDGGMLIVDDSGLILVSAD